MKSGDKVRVTSLSSKLEFGSEHTVNETCSVLDKMVVYGDERIHKMSDVKVVKDLVPRAGEFWVMRCGRIVLVATVDADRNRMMVVDKPFVNGEPYLEIYYSDGRFAEALQTDRDLICPIRSNRLTVGSVYGVFVQEEVQCSY